MATNYTLTISDPNNLLGSNKALVIKDMDYVMSYISQYVVFQKPLDLQIVVQPSSANPFNTDGLLPSIPAWVSYNGNTTLAAMVKGQTGIDPNGSTPDAGFTIYLGNDGTVKNYGRPVWFDPNPQLGVVPSIPNGSDDFISIATHELFHCFGFATNPQGVNAPWNQHTIQQNGIWYYSSPTIDGIVGGNIPLDPNELPGQAGDHLGNTSISYQPIKSDLMYVNGNYENNRLDIGQVDLLILKDLGWTIQNYQNLPLVDPIDKYNMVGTAGNDVINASKFSSIISTGAGNDTIILPGGTGNGNYFIDGGPGIDKLVVPQASSIFNIVRYGSDFLLQSKDGSEGVSLLRSVENIQFSDKTVTLDNSPDLTTPASTTYQKMYSVAPSSAELNVLVQFNSAQYAFGVKIQVQDPIVYVYSALGQALSVQSDTGSTAFKGTWGPLAIPSDATFVTKAYADVFGTQGSAAQIQSFIGQVNFYKSLYTTSGAFGTDANQIDLLARGAVYGTMLGVKAENSGPIPFESNPNPDTTLIGTSAAHDVAHILI